MESKLEKLFYAIESSKEYQEYLKMSDILAKDEEIKKLIDEIKELERRATYLESIGDKKYLEIDEEITKKEVILNSKPIYQEYLNKMDEFNDELAISTDMITKYISEKV